MTVIDDYLADVPAPQRAALENIRQLVHQTAPEAQEVITYGMPGFKYKNKYLVAFAPFKDHLSLFPGSEAVETFKDQLGDHATAKGTIQFTLDNLLSEDLVRQILLARIASIEHK